MTSFILNHSFIKNTSGNRCVFLMQKNNNIGNRCVIYARYSSENQREESIDGQLRECTAFAQHNDIQIVGEYIDRAFSAKTDNRPSFQIVRKVNLMLSLFGN